VPASALGADGKAAASERITVGFIGCGKMANDYHLSTLPREAGYLHPSAHRASPKGPDPRVRKITANLLSRFREAGY
jgi:hypothetical protein